MAGSVKYFEYTLDNGEKFAIRRDESNSEGVLTLGGATNEDEADYTPTSLPNYELPRNVSPRTVTFASADNRIRRTFTVMRADRFQAISNTDSVTVGDGAGGNVVLRLAKKKGEEIRIPRADDTGLNDGDAT